MEDLVINNMKKLEEIAFIVQARLNSARLPNKVIKNFADNKSLFEIALEKLCSVDEINNNQIYGRRRKTHQYS